MAADPTSTTQGYTEKNVAGRDVHGKLEGNADLLSEAVKEEIIRLAAATGADANELMVAERKAQLQEVDNQAFAHKPVYTPHLEDPAFAPPAAP